MLESPFLQIRHDPNRRMQMIQHAATAARALAIPSARALAAGEALDPGDEALMLWHEKL